MTLTIYRGLEQGTDEWLKARCGILTASTVGQLITMRSASADSIPCPECDAIALEQCISKSTGKPVKFFHGGRTEAARDLPKSPVCSTSDTAFGLIKSLTAERITGHVEQVYISRDMERGNLEEPLARDLYARSQGVNVEQLGFMVRIINGMPLGYSPDGLVGEDGLIEIKSRRQKKQVETIVTDEVPAENMAQLQAALLVSGRDWIDYVSYSNGMHLYTKRVHLDEAWGDAICTALEIYEGHATKVANEYATHTAGLPLAERYEDLTGDF